MTSLGEALVGWLETYGVDTVFGIPGVHTIELYRGLAASRIRHLTPRHEQGAGFMADGYARASGRVAAAFVITGPGLTNIATAMAQAYADSVPVLVISSVNARPELGLRAGDLHEVSRQGLIAEQCAAFSHTLSDPSQLPEVLARAFAVFEGARPRPVHIEIPRDLLAAECEPAPLTRPAALRRAVPELAALAEAVAVLDAASRPVILAGGGLRDRGAEALRRLAERLDAPVILTTNARGLLGFDHPLEVPASPSLAAVRDMIDGADVVLALGTEIGSTDYDMYGRGDFRVPGRLIRVDIDPEQLMRGAVPELPLIGDAAKTAAAIAGALGEGAAKAGGAGWAASARLAALEEVGPDYRAAIAVNEQITSALPGVPIVGDSTHAIYAGNLYHRATGPAEWFNAATGYGALGYGLPAAIGAAHARRGPVVCVTGDGGLQFSFAELGLAVEAGLPLILLVWNNSGYGEIKHWMQRAGVTPVGVDLHTPDFVGLAEAYGAVGLRLTSLDALGEMLEEAAARPGPTLIELPESLVFSRRD